MPPPNHGFKQLLQLVALVGQMPVLFVIIAKPRFASSVKVAFLRVRPSKYLYGLYEREEMSLGQR